MNHRLIEEGKYNESNTNVDGFAQQKQKQVASFSEISVNNFQFIGRPPSSISSAHKILFVTSLKKTLSKGYCEDKN